MPDISVQFLALPEELADFFARCVFDHGLHVVKVTFPPYHAEAVPRESLVDMFSDSSNVSDLSFTMEAPILVDKTRYIQDENPDALRLNIGKRSSEGLRESHLSAKTVNMEAFGVWKKIAKKLEAITSKGAIATNPDTGVSGPAKWYRFTEGAKELNGSGIRLLSCTGHILRPVTKAAEVRNRVTDSNGS